VMTCHFFILCILYLCAHFQGDEARSEGSRSEAQRSFHARRLKSKSYEINTVGKV
jgi:hypothetical protein